MILLPPRSTRTDTLFPYTTLFRALGKFAQRPLGLGHIARKLGLDPLESFFDRGVGGFVPRGIDDIDLAQRLNAVARHRRSEERRVGKECVSKCRSRWSPYH